MVTLEINTNALMETRTFPSFPNRQLEQYQKEIKLQTVLETHTQTMVG